MPDYAYTARDRAGSPVEGTIFADNSALAAGKLKEMGLALERVRPIELRRESQNLGKIFIETFVYPVSSGVPLKELIVFYRQFATMINAGIPLYQSLVTIENQVRNQKLKGIVRECQRQVERGGKLSEIFAAHPWVFSELQIEMIRAAEQGGMLDQMLLRIADYLEKEMELRRLVSRVTLYPKIVVLTALLILGKGFFADLKPAIAKLIVGAVFAMSDYGVWDYLNDTVFFVAIIGLIIFGIVAFCRIVLFQSESARISYEKFKMGLPAIGPAVRGFALAKFGRAFGAMYAAGLPLNSAIRVAGRASGNATFTRATAQVITSVEQGKPISLAFRETGVFPPIVIDMLHTGEQTGNMDAMMQKAAEYLENEASSKAHMNAHIFATVVYLIVAIMVAFAVISFYAGGGSSSASGMLNGPAE